MSYTPQLNEFSGVSDRTLAARLKHWREHLAAIDAADGCAGGGSPREFPLEMIEALEAETSRRAQRRLAK